MKRTPSSPTESERSRGAATAGASTTSPLLAFGAHPDDIEFGCGGIIAKETRAGRAAHFVVCSRGEAATNGTPDEREAEARRGATILGATIEFIDLGGDAHFEINVAHTLVLAAIIRRVRPSTVLAPTTGENQHPDHSRLGKLVRDAARLARYGGVEELKGRPAHAIDRLFFYAITPGAEPTAVPPVFIDVSEHAIVERWTAAMEAHGTQKATRDYVALQIGRAIVNGRRGGALSAIALYPNDPLVFDSLAALERGARHF